MQIEKIHHVHIHVKDLQKAANRIFRESRSCRETGNKGGNQWLKR